MMMSVLRKVLIIDDDPDQVVNYYRKAVLDDPRYDKEPDVIRRPEDVTKDKLMKVDIILLDFIFKNSAHNGSYVLNLIKSFNKDKKEVIAKIILLSSMTNYSQWNEKDKLEGLSHLGVTDFILKPIADEFPEIFKFQLDRVLEFLDNAETISAQHKDIQCLFKLKSAPQIIGQSKGMCRVIGLINKVAEKDANVLITGETGTGKEVVAQCIHYYSKRKDGPFVGVNCGEFASTMIEDKLFGHEKGAYTGAESRTIGYFEKASGGTLFLDEITEIEPNLQKKLLRVIQERVFERLGGQKPIMADVRIIAATNRPLKNAIKDGYMREDLYYRLSTFPIDIPPLRDRVEDIEPLAMHFLKQNYKDIGREITNISDSAIKKLMQHNWPGNVRELGNVIDRVIILSNSSVVSEDDIVFDKILQTDHSLEGDTDGTDLFNVKGIITRLVDDRDKAKALFEDTYGIKFTDLEVKWDKDPDNMSKYLELREFKFRNDHDFGPGIKVSLIPEIKKHLREVEKVNRVTDKLVAITLGMSHGSLRGMLTRERKKNTRD
jgi:DNA-binding NtrC family response regulator